MRLYTFTNMYLSQIQRGIQSAHLVHELFNKYNDIHPEFDKEFLGQEMMLNEWSLDHKTMIVLNGGYSENLHELMGRFSHTGNPYPYEMFYEAQESLGGALTCVGIVLPEKIYTGAAMLRSDRDLLEQLDNTGQLETDSITGVPIVWEYTKWERDLMVELNKYSLA